MTWTSSILNIWQSIRQQDKIDLLTKELESINKDLNTCNILQQDQSAKVHELEQAIEKLSNDDVLAHEWNKRWAQNTVIYSARQINYDPKTLITPNNTILQELIKKNKLVGTNNDDTATNMMNYVIKKIAYVTDSRNNGFNEFWQFPEETIAYNKGDCEDQAILTISLMLSAGIKPYRCKVAVGWVNDPKNEQRTYHAYPLYLRELDNQWVTLDTTWYPQKTHVKDKIPVKEIQGIYLNPDWTFNNEHTWAQHSFTFNEAPQK